MNAEHQTSMEEKIEVLKKMLDKMDADVASANDAIVQAKKALNGAAERIANQNKTIARLQQIEAAARNLAKVKGRHNSEQAMNQLLETLK